MRSSCDVHHKVASQSLSGHPSSSTPQPSDSCAVGVTDVSACIRSIAELIDMSSIDMLRVVLPWSALACRGGRGLTCATARLQACLCCPKLLVCLEWAET